MELVSAVRQGFSAPICEKPTVSLSAAKTDPDMAIAETANRAAILLFMEKLQLRLKFAQGFPPRNGRCKRIVWTLLMSRRPSSGAGPPRYCSVQNRLLTRFHWK